MSIPLYDASVPVFVRYLGRLAALIDAAELHGRVGSVSSEALLAARLAPDMAPFATQAVIAANFALRACFPLAGLAVPPYGDFADSVDGLRARIARVLGLLGTLHPSQFEGGESRVLESRAGDALVCLPASEFLFQYALPNFFFHLTAAYAILRHQGVAIGKADFDGFHQYPAVR